MIIPEYRAFAPSRRIILNRLSLILLVGLLMIVTGCSASSWRNQGDSCIHISEEPPMRRVINYSDHDLCGRKLPPRTPPNPRTRLQTEME